MAKPALTPVQLVNEVFLPEVSDGMIVAVLSSFGATIRLALSPADAHSLGRTLMGATKAAVSQRQESNVVAFARTA